MKAITTTKLIIFAAAFLMLFGNAAFFGNVLEVYPLNVRNGLFLLSLFPVFGCAIVFLLSLVCFRHTVKPVLITLFLLSSGAAYFMDSYNVIIDHVMIDSILKTDQGELMDLLSLDLLLYIVLLGLLPSILVYRVRIADQPFSRALLFTLLRLGGSLGVAVATILLLSDFYASFFREHKPLRFYANPSFYLYSAGRYVGGFYKGGTMPFREIALDAQIPPSDIHRELVVMVVGETARADHFSLNGYPRQTNPRLEQEEVLSFSNVWACGTSTATAVPCMFSLYNYSDYTINKANRSENLLDVLQRAGVNVLWLDNNSDSKGVAARVLYESYKAPDKNPICDSECRDEGMLLNLHQYIDSHPEGDIFIVLHQMGNHGPAYHKRYPDAFERFTPACKSRQLESCTAEEINNAYDNAILYTDYFLSKVIDLLKEHSTEFESILFYVSDHGESLGESGIYLHGLPYLIAPDAQKHVPMVMWFSDSFDNRQESQFERLQGRVDGRYSHDNIFHTVLGLLEVETAVYERSLDLVQHDEE